jgi:cyanophycinase
MSRVLLVVGTWFLVALSLSSGEPRTDGTGSLLLVGGGLIRKDVKRRFLELAGGPGAHVIVIPSASALPEAGDEGREFWEEEGAQVRVLHTTSRAEADRPAFCQALRWATGVWIPGGDQVRFMSIYGGTGVERELVALYRHGGVIGGTSAGASLASRVMIAHEGEARGLGLLEGVVVDQHFDTRARLTRLLHVLEHHPEQLGIGLDEETGVIIRSATLTVVGQKTVSVCRVGSGAKVYHTGEQVALGR